jgi:hypothetical protein
MKLNNQPQFKLPLEKRLLRNAEIVKDFEDGSSYKKAGAKHGLSREMVRQILLRYYGDEGILRYAVLENRSRRKKATAYKKLLRMNNCPACGKPISGKSQTCKFCRPKRTAEFLAAYRKKYYAEHREKIKAYQLANRERINVYQAAYQRQKWSKPEFRQQVAARFRKRYETDDAFREKVKEQSRAGYVKRKLRNKK